MTDKNKTSTELGQENDGKHTERDGPLSRDVPFSGRSVFGGSEMTGFNSF